MKKSEIIRNLKQLSVLFNQCQSIVTDLKSIDQPTDETDATPEDIEELMDQLSDIFGRGQGGVNVLDEIDSTLEALCDEYINEK